MNNKSVEKQVFSTADVHFNIERFKQFDHHFRNLIHNVTFFSKLGLAGIETRPREKLLKYFSEIQTCGERLGTVLAELRSEARTCPNATPRQDGFKQSENIISPPASRPYGQ